MSISASEARQRLFPLLEQVNTDHQPVRITSRAGDAVLMSADDYDSWQETVYLLRSPENARRLMEAVARDKTSQPAAAKYTTSIDELRELAGGEDYKQDKGENLYRRSLYTFWKRAVAPPEMMIALYLLLAWERAARTRSALSGRTPRSTAADPTALASPSSIGTLAS